MTVLPARSTTAASSGTGTLAARPTAAMRPSSTTSTPPPMGGPPSPVMRVAPWYATTVLTGASGASPPQLAASTVSRMPAGANRMVI